MFTPLYFNFPNATWIEYAPLAPVISRCTSSADPIRLLLYRLILLGLMRIGSELWKVTGAMIRNLFPDVYISPFASPCNILCVNAPLPVGQYYVHWIMTVSRSPFSPAIRILRCVNMQKVLVLTLSDVTGDQRFIIIDLSWASINLSLKYD